MDPKVEKRLSKCLSWALRHGAQELKLTMDSEGYVPVKEILQLKEVTRLKPDITLSDLEHIVNTNDKQRFALQNDAIRANQGHSKSVGDQLTDASMLQLLEKPLPLCVHGTTKKAIREIKESGLQPMGRKHIHLATGLPSDSKVKSGMRGSSTVVIHINMEKAMADGKRFFLSDNGVVLTPDSLPPEYFAKVVYK